MCTQGERVHVLKSLQNTWTKLIEIAGRCRIGLVFNELCQAWGMCNRRMHLGCQMRVWHIRIRSDRSEEFFWSYRVGSYSQSQPERINYQPGCRHPATEVLQAARGSTALSTSVSRGAAPWAQHRALLLVSGAHGPSLSIILEQSSCLPFCRSFTLSTVFNSTSPRLAHSVMENNISS